MDPHPTLKFFFFLLIWAPVLLMGLVFCFINFDDFSLVNVKDDTALFNYLLA